MSESAMRPRFQAVKNTPGPWEVPGATFAEEQQPGIPGHAFFVNGPDGKPLPAGPANARLIASAPDLLEALEDAHLFLCYITEENTDARNDVDLLIAFADKLRTRISKATGGSWKP